MFFRVEEVYERTAPRPFYINASSVMNIREDRPATKWDEGKRNFIMDDNGDRALFPTTKLYAPGAGTPRGGARCYGTPEEILKSVVLVPPPPAIELECGHVGGTTPDETPEE